MKAEHTLDSLLDSYAFAVRSYALAPDAEAAARIDVARAALLAHVATRYVRRDDPRYRILDRANERVIGYTAARGILPWKTGDELPEERIRRLRDGTD